MLRVWEVYAAVFAHNHVGGWCDHVGQSKAFICLWFVAMGSWHKLKLIAVAHEEHSCNLFLFCFHFIMSSLLSLTMWWSGELIPLSGVAIFEHKLAVSLGDLDLLQGQPVQRLVLLNLSFKLSRDRQSMCRGHPWQTHQLNCCNNNNNNLEDQSSRHKLPDSWVTILVPLNWFLCGLLP